MEDSGLATATAWASRLETIADVAFALVIVFLLVELIAGRVAKRFEKTIDSARELHIAQLENETADARERTAKLERATAPRALSQQEMREMSEALKKAPPVQYTLGLGPIEIGSSFLSQLIQALRDGGWTLSQVQYGRCIRPLWFWGQFQPEPMQKLGAALEPDGDRVQVKSSQNK